MVRPLKIAILAHEFPALSETFVLGHATGLIDLGHDVTILADRPRPEAKAHIAIDRYRLMDRTIYRTSPGNKVARSVGAIMRAGNRAVRHPFGAVRALRAVRYGNGMSGVNLLDWWTRFEDLPHFDIVHAHFGPMGKTAVALRAIGALGGRVVTTFHGVDMSRNLLSDPSLYSDLFRFGDAFLPVSEYWRHRLIELGCPPDRVHVHHMGIDVARIPFHPRRLTIRGRTERPLRVITVGRLVEKKGIRYALEAIASFLHQGYEATYTVVGDGPMRTHLRRLAGVLGIGARVRFLGARDHRNVMQLIGQSDVMLAPSTTDGEGDQEGIPVTLMEAMAAGLPVVSTLHSGIPELVEHGESGLLVIERDVEGLASALRELVETEGLAARFAETARAAVERDFNHGLLIKNLVDYYESVLDRPTRRVESLGRATLRPAGHPRPTEAFRS